MTTSDSLAFIATQSPDAMGIVASRFDTKTGDLSAPELVAATPDPGFIALGIDGAHLYVCNSRTPGGVSAFAVDARSGALSFLNHVRTQGRGPSHLSLDRSGRYVLNANYGGAYVEIHAIERDGRIGNRTAFVELTGRSVHPVRQTRAYPHWFGVDPSNRFALAADLGSDRIMVYRFDRESGAIEPNDPPWASVRPGSGPRHLAWHPNGRFLYAVQELSNEVVSYAWDDERGTLTELQTVSTLPPGFSGENTAAEIGVHTNGRFLYVSNRGHDSLAVFAIDPAHGTLEPVEHVSSCGKTPRYFAFDASCEWLTVTNQESAGIAVFRVDASTGRLTPHRDIARLDRPMGVVLMTT